jgi:hypothetical protein
VRSRPIPPRLVDSSPPLSLSRSPLFYWTTYTPAAPIFDTLDFLHSKLSVHGQRGFKPTPGLLRDYLYLIRSVTRIFIDTITNRELRIHRHSVNPERKRGTTNGSSCTVLYYGHCTRIVRDLCALLMEW